MNLLEDFDNCLINSCKLAGMTEDETKDYLMNSPMRTKLLEAMLITRPMNHFYIVNRNQTVSVVDKTTETNEQK